MILALGWAWEGAVMRKWLRAAALVTPLVALMLAGGG